MNRQNSLHRVAGTVLFAAAMALGSTSASALCSIDVQDPVTTVTPGAAGTYGYAYAVAGVTGSCVGFGNAANFQIGSFDLPYLPSAGISAITSPTGWSAQVVNTDTFGLGNGAETLVWTAGAGYDIPAFVYDGNPAPLLSGFGYTALGGPVAGLGGVQVSNDEYLTQLDVQFAGSPSAVPEPSGLLAMLAGLGCVAALRRRRA